ncbi:MAG: hypothetical protein OEY59_12480 [Deltaproteobacteria bacterium]|nr:hypothetical protein [Deltaproteobacteria bacterium]
MTQYYDLKLDLITFDPELDAGGNPVELFGIDALEQTFLIYLWNHPRTRDLINVNQVHARQIISDIEDGLETDLGFVKVGSVTISFIDSILSAEGLADLNGEIKPLSVKLDLKP